MNLRADNGNAALSIGISHALDATGALVEGSETRSEVRRIPRVSWHLGQTTGDLTECFCPT